METSSTPDRGGGADSGTDGGAGTTQQPPQQRYAPFAPDGGVCPDGWFLWNEYQGGPTPSDRLCHRTCRSDADCADPVPYCWTVGLSLGGDYGCNGRAKFCAEPAADQCTR